MKKAERGNQPKYIDQMIRENMVNFELVQKGLVGNLIQKDDRLLFQIKNASDEINRMDGLGPHNPFSAMPEFNISEVQESFNHMKSFAMRMLDML